MICYFEKHMRFNPPAGGKNYRAVMLCEGRRRLSRRRFPKASQAAVYGHRLAKRARGWPVCDDGQQ